MIDKNTFIKNFRSVHDNLPIGAVATSVGATTLSNIFALRELTFLKDIFMNMAAIVALFALLKLFFYPKTVKKELDLPVLASVFPTFGMLIMILGNYYLKFSYILGKTMWLFGIVIYSVISIIAIYKHLIKNFNFNTFVPSFFIPFVGSLVACVSSTGMNAPILTKVIFYWGTTTYFIILPFMIYRLYKGDIEKQIYPTVVIMAAPPSLVIISYLTVFTTYNRNFVGLMAVIVFSITLYSYIQIPKCLKEKFNAGFASLTFPLAATTLATFKISMYFLTVNVTLAHLFEGIGVVELFIATSVIGFVLYNLFYLLFQKLTMQDAIE